MDVARRDGDCRLEGGHPRRGVEEGGQPALRLDLRIVAGLGETARDLRDRGHLLGGLQAPSRDFR